MPKRLEGIVASHYLSWFQITDSKKPFSSQTYTGTKILKNILHYFIVFLPLQMISLFQHCYTRAKRGTLRTNPNDFNNNSKNIALSMYQALFQYFNINSDTVIIPIFTNEETN